jgi:hypothetical protein
MSCLNLALPSPPQIPPILLPSFGFVLQLNFGTAGINCCAVKLPAFQIPLTIPLPPALLIPAITAINALILAAMPVLDNIDIPDCPMNGDQL